MQLKKWTEQEAEVWAERQMDKLDEHYMQGELTQEEYDLEVERLDEEVKILLRH